MVLDGERGESGTIPYTISEKSGLSYGDGRSGIDGGVIFVTDTYFSETPISCGLARRSIRANLPDWKGNPSRLFLPDRASTLEKRGKVE